MSACAAPYLKLVTLFKYLHIEVGADVEVTIIVCTILTMLGDNGLEQHLSSINGSTT